MAVRVHAPDWFSHSSSPPRRRPSPAAPQPPPRGHVERRCRAVSLRPAAQASVAVSAFLPLPPDTLQTAHTTTPRASRSRPATASLVSRASYQPHSPAAPVHQRRHMQSLPQPPTWPSPRLHETQRNAPVRLLYSLLCRCVSLVRCSPRHSRRIPEPIPNIPRPGPACDPACLSFPISNIHLLVSESSMLLPTYAPLQSTK